MKQSSLTLSKVTLSAAVKSALVQSAVSSSSNGPPIPLGAVNLLVVFGQSQLNCNGTMLAGYDVPTNLQPAMTDVRIWNKFTSAFETYQAGVNSVPAINGGGASGQPNYYGPEAEYARRWKRDNPGVPLNIVKLGVSSSSLSSVTAGPNGYWDPAASGQLYSILKTDVLNAIAVLNAQGYTVNVTALFVQGENDTGAAGAYNAYATNLRALISACRADFLGANGPFVIGRVKDAGSAPTGFAAVRAAQQLVGETDTACRWFDMDGMQLSTDAFHFGPAGTQEMGQRAYDTAMKATDVVAKYVAQMTTPASSADQALMVTMLDYIIRRGAWATIAHMNLYTQDTQQAALLNLKPGVAQTSVNSGMTFTPRVGFIGTGLTSKVDTGVIMNNGGDTLIKASSFAVSWYSRSNTPGSADVGVNSAGGGILAYATDVVTSPTNTYRILSDTPATSIPNPTTVNGFWTLDRVTSSLAPVWYNGTKLGTELGAVGNTLPTLPIWVGNRNNNNNAGGTKSYQMFIAGRGRTDYQEAAIATAVQAYVTAMGAN